MKKLRIVTNFFIIFVVTIVSAFAINAVFYKYYYPDISFENKEIVIDQMIANELKQKFEDTMVIENAPEFVYCLAGEETDTKLIITEYKDQTVINGTRIEATFEECPNTINGKKTLGFTHPHFDLGKYSGCLLSEADIKTLQDQTYRNQRIAGVLCQDQNGDVKHILYTLNAYEVQ